MTDDRMIDADILMVASVFSVATVFSAVEVVFFRSDSVWNQSQAY